MGHYGVVQTQPRTGKLGKYRSDQRNQSFPFSENDNAESPPHSQSQGEATITGRAVIKNHLGARTCKSKAEDLRFSLPQVPRNDSGIERSGSADMGMSLRRHPFTGGIGFPAAHDFPRDSGWYVWFGAKPQQKFKSPGARERDDGRRVDDPRSVHCDSSRSSSSGVTWKGDTPN